jgi:ketosteroid isomerase-like protein
LEEQLMHSYTGRPKFALVRASETNGMTAANSETPEEQIRVLMKDRVRALCGRDLHAPTSRLAPGILSFDTVKPRRYSASDAITKRLAEWLSSFQGPIAYEVAILRIALADDVAFCHSLNWGSATRTDGARIDKWWFATVCFCKTDGNWAITHEHSSAAFDVNGCRGLLDV